MVKERGFTLIETIVYSGIVVVVFVAAIYFVVDIASIKVKANSMIEVQQNGRFAIERMSQEIRSAIGVNVGDSIFGSNPGTLSLQMADVSKNPTIFDISGGRLQITQGVGPTYELTSDEVEVTNLVFTNLSQAKAPKNIKINLTVERVNPGDNSDMEASINLEAAAAPRRE